MKQKLSTILALSSIVFAISCTKDTTPAATTVKQWNVTTSTKNENPAVANRAESGTVVLELLSDNSLKYTITVNGLASSDMLMFAHLHVGNAISNGGVVLNLAPTFTGGTATGTVTDLRTSLVDSLKNDANEIYFNAHSMQVTGGLVRGQLNSNVEVAADVVMSGANEVPAVTTTATGLATLRVTANKQLYARVVVSNLEVADALTAAHIHRGAAGANGAVMTGFYTSAADFGTIKTISVDDATFLSLKNDALYFNAHSTLRGSGIVRGQIR